MKTETLRHHAPLALGMMLALAASPAMAQITPTITPTQSPVSAAITAATEVREATVREVYGVDNGSGCDLLLTAGGGNPVLYRRASASSTGRMEIFTGDTGLALSGRDFALLQSATLRLSTGAAIPGTIVRRRLAGTQCGETPGSGAGVAVLRFAIPAQTVVNNATIEMRTRRQYPPSAFALTPCDPKAIGAALEGGLEKFAHCFPERQFDMPAIPVSLVPRPNIASLTIGMETDGTTSSRIRTGSPIEVLATLVGTGLSRVDSLRHEVLPGSAFGASALSFTFGIARPTFLVMWTNPVAGQTASGRVTPTVPMLRFPRGSGAATSVRRTVIDTAWAGSVTDVLRSMGEGRYAITALAAASGTGGGTTTAPAAITIKAFDPGNILFNAGGGTTTVADTGVSSTMTGLDSESWCATVPQPTAGAGGARVVAQGIANLPALRWGVRNEGTAAFNGSITAELRLRGRVVDTLTFTGALPAGGTQVKSFTRPVSQVTVARESLGPKCFYVGDPSDPVLENSAYDVKVITPAAHTKTLTSLP